MYNIIWVCVCARMFVWIVLDIFRYFLTVLKITEGKTCGCTCVRSSQSKLDFAFENAEKPNHWP